MSELDRRNSERYYLTYQRVMVLGLVFAVCMGAYMLVHLLVGADSGIGGWIIIGTYFAGIVGIQRFTLGRIWSMRDPEVRTIVRDEWVLTSRNRAIQTAFWVMLLTPLPLMYLLREVPTEPTVSKFAALMVLVGMGTFFGSYLYWSRQRSHE